jgi:hypothetical protein
MGAPEVAVGRTPQIALDRDRVRRRFGRFPPNYVRYSGVDAIDLLPPAKVYASAWRYLNVRPRRTVPDC